MIDTKELRRDASVAHIGHMPMELSGSEIIELLDRLEAAEKEREELRNEITCVKEVEFPRKAQAVADAWKGKCERLEAERDDLRAKVAEMERQEPAEWQYRTRPKWNDGTWGQWSKCSEEHAQYVKKPPPCPTTGFTRPVRSTPFLAQKENDHVATD